MARACLLLAVLALAGCSGYSTERLTTVPGARTVAVRTFSNRGFRRDLELRLTQAVLAELRARTSYAIVDPAHADLVIDGEVEANEGVITLDANDDPLQKRLGGGVTVKVTDRRGGCVVASFVARAQTEFTPGRHGQSLDGSATDEWVRRVAVEVVQGLERGF